MQDAVAQLLPQRRGHFVFESGHHGQVWLDLELLFLHPERVQPLAEALAERLRGFGAAVICGPLVEGAFVGLAVARALGLPFSYSEPTRDDVEADLFPVSYPIPRPLHPQLRGQRVAIVNDVINAGSAVRGTFIDLQSCGAEVVSLASLAALGDWAERFATAERLNMVTLEKFANSVWEPATCPLCANGEPLIDPASAMGTR